MSLFIMILDVVSDCFSSSVVAQVQQAIASSEDVQQLKKFNRRVVRLSNARAL